MKHITPILLVLAIAACVAWLSFPPSDHANAQSYGPNVTSNLKRFNVVASSSGDNELVEAVSGKRFRIISLALIAQSSTSVDAYLINGDNELLGTAAAPQPIDMSAVDGLAGVVLPANEGGWLETDTANEALEINLSGAQAVLCVGTYVEVD